MSYIGNNLQVAYPSYANIDDISGSFDGVTTSFPLTVGGVAPIPAPLSSNQCLISVGGVVQRPDDSGSEGFLLSGGNIVFSAAPTGGDDFFGVILAGADYVNVGVNFPSGTASTPSITFDADLDTGLFNSGANELAITTAGTSRLVVDSGGNVNIDAGGAYYAASTNRVGIGTTSPSYELVVKGAAASTLQILSSGTTNLSRLFFGDDNDLARGFINYDHSDDSMRFGANNSERARIDSSGRLLVGTSSASFSTTVKLQGNNASSTGESRIRLCRGTASPANGDTLAILGFSDNTETPSAEIAAQRDGGTWSASSVPGRLVFSTTADGASSPTERMRILQSGDVQLLGAGNVFSVESSGAPGTTVRTIFSGHSSTGFGSRVISFQVWNNGNVQNTNNSYGAISDVKLKENIVDATSQWDDLKALQVRKYNFKEETGQETHTQIGLIAQEVELVSPGLVTESPDRDAEGNDLGTVTKSVNYSVLYMKAVKALQEAMERIEQLESEMAAVKAQLA